MDDATDAGGVAACREGRVGVAEGGEVGVELGAVMLLEGVEPAAMGEEPEARVAEAERVGVRCSPTRSNPMQCVVRMAWVITGLRNLITLLVTSFFLSDFMCFVCSFDQISCVLCG
jgi:hypothetical protein